MLKANHINRTFGDVVALRDISMSLAPGAIHVVIGPSGSGKTTLIRALSMLDPPDTGQIELDGQIYEFPDTAQMLEKRPPWPRVTVVFQQLFLWPHLTLRQNITLAPMANGGRQDHLEEFIDLFAMGAFIDRYPNEVSVGQRQRAALARAVTANPSYILLDEITSALDVEQTRTILHYLKALSQRGIGLLLVTHAIDLARALVTGSPNNRFCFLRDGEIRAQGGAAEFLDPQQEALANFLSIHHSGGRA